MSQSERSFRPSILRRILPKPPASPCPSDPVVVKVPPPTVTMAFSNSQKGPQKCAFCRRTFQRSTYPSMAAVGKNEVGVVKQAVSVSIPTFTHVWTYLGPELRRKVEECYAGFQSTMTSASVSARVPPVCTECYEVILQIHVAHNEMKSLREKLESQVTRLKMVVASSGKNCAARNASGVTTRRNVELMGVDRNNVHEGAVLSKSLDSKRVADDQSFGGEGEHEGIKHERNDNDEHDFDKDPPIAFVKTELDEDEDTGCDFDSLVHSERPTPSKTNKGKDEQNTRKPLTTSSNFERVKELQNPAGPSTTGLSNIFSDRSTIKVRRPVKVIPKQCCEICTEQVPVTQIYQHLRNHVQDYILKCLNPRCQHAFVSTQGLSRHLRKREQCLVIAKQRGIIPGCFWHESVTKCEECGFVPEPGSKVHTNLLLHLNKTHETDSKNYQCPITGCTESFTVRQSVQAHLSKHRMLPKRVVTSQICQFCLQKIDVKSMLQHYKKEHKIEAFSCQICSVTFLQRLELFDHHFSEHSGEDLACEFCPELKFHGSRKFRMHYFQVHKVGEQLICEYCDASFFSLPNLKTHVQAIHLSLNPPKPKPEVKCDLCDGIFTTEGALAKHKVRKHGDKRFECKQCGKTAISLAFLKAHERKVHQKLNPRIYVRLNRTCDECGRTFSAPPVLRSHILRAHPKDPNLKPFICDTCGKGFVDNESLKGHVKTVHPTTKQICHTCGMSFSTPNSLKRHMLTHTGERPFACDVCGQRFRHKVTLKTHVTSHERLGDKFRPKGEMMERKPRRQKI